MTSSVCPHFGMKVSFLRIDGGHTAFLFSYEDDKRIKDPETGLPSAERFCQHLIEPIGRDADHLSQLLLRYFGMRVDICIQ